MSQQYDQDVSRAHSQRSSPKHDQSISRAHSRIDPNTYGPSSHSESSHASSEFARSVAQEEQWFENELSAETNLGHGTLDGDGTVVGVDEDESLTSPVGMQGEREALPGSATW